MKLFLSTLLFCLAVLSLHGQTTYTMDNLTVDDCEGFLQDSEAGDVAGNYDHNENFTFTICVPDADQIILTFFSFCTEENFDSLRIFDGPDTLSMQIGPTYTGEDDPPTITANSGCLTVNFISDASVSCTGWYAFWETVVEIPTPPDILPIADVPCESTSLTITLDESVSCDSIYPGAFSITGPISPTIIDAQPTPCNGGMTNTITLTFDPMLDFSGNYQVTFINSKTLCNETYELVSTAPFAVTDCPLNVVLELDGTITCAGDTALLIANASGGDPNTYDFDWSPVTSNIGFAIIIPTSPTTYYVTVTDGNGASATDSIFIDPLPPPTLTPMDTSICQSTDPFFLAAVPAGGTWTGAGIPAGEETTGLFDPGIVNQPSTLIGYTDLNGCSSEVQITIIPLDPGPPEAACPGSPTFAVSGFQPAGGSWSGPFIDPAGNFTPPGMGGVYTITYTHPNGCSDEKDIFVEDIVLPPSDSICESTPIFDLVANPPAGIWSGNGITDPFLGTFDPATASVGDNELIYSINGCTDTLTLHVIQIDALWNISACPEEDPFILPGNWQPMGIGVWSGVGIADPITGLYDPSLTPNGLNDTLTFTANGCTDTRIVFVRQTTIFKDDLEFCPEDDPIELNWASVMRTPGGGQWTGAGITNPSGSTYFFNPGLAGAGIHTLEYLANTCLDSMTMIVHPTPTIQADTLCEIEAPLNLTVAPGGGVWNGSGITDTLLGTFNPGLAGLGPHIISNVSDNGCYGEQEILVTEPPVAEISGLEPFYCFQDTTIVPALSPPGGLLTINGDPAIDLNPALLGPGEHLLNYTVGQDQCQDATFFLITVGEPLDIQLPFTVDSICLGEGLQISAQGLGGSSNGIYDYNWNQGLGFGQTHQIQPLSSTTYQVTITDGCSDPAIGSIAIGLYPDFQIAFETGEPVCYDDTTWVEISASPGSNFNFTWNTNPPFMGTYLESYPTAYTVDVLNLDTGCEQEATVDVPGYDPIQANFSLVPGDDCLTNLEPEMQILDFSSGATSGFWDFGDGSSPQPYVLGQTLVYSYPDTGEYTVSLTIENEGGCSSYHEASICVILESRLFAPTAFSPNGDGVNEIFKFVGLEVTSLDWEVYNRYGELMYRGQGLNDAWDGFYRGERVPQGVYTVVAVYTTATDPNRQTYKGFVTVLH
jgi:gliding motility-associated-like protein